ncbi:MAG: Gfo/Idh/MocA family oxidoreductase [Victivallales bacterium]|nr:Gfo/Idh/MocA family oxidoreductase [Victivallales bacterium]
MRKKIGIVGFGEMGKRHGLEFMDSTAGRIELVSVVEPNDQRYVQGCEWTKCEPARFADVEEMVEKSDLNGVVIASPNSQHLANLKALSGRNLPVLLEKPLETNLEKICDIARFAAEYDGPIVVDHVMRYAPIIARARELIQEGRIGKVCSFNFTLRHHGGAMFHTFRRSLQGGGGQMVEKATHDLDVILFLADARPARVTAIGKQHVYGGDKPNDLHCAECDDALYCESVAAIGRNQNKMLKDVNTSDDLCAFSKEVDTADNEVCLIELDNNIFGTFSQCYFACGDRSREYEIIGSEGLMRLSLSGNPDGKLSLFSRNDSSEALEYHYQYHGKIHYNGGKYVAKHFYDIMCGKAEPFTTVNQAFVAEMLACAAMRAGDEGLFIDVASIVPEDLKDRYNKTYF